MVLGPALRWRTLSRSVRSAHPCAAPRIGPRRAHDRRCPRGEPPRRWKACVRACVRGVGLALVTDRARLRRGRVRADRTKRRQFSQGESPCSTHSRSLQFLERLVPFESRIRRRSASLAKQLADASESIALNLGEGRLRHAGDKRRHLEMAAGSASEVTVALRIAVAKRYVTTAELVEVEAVLDRIRAMLYRLTR
jgi:four helix bundle protein